MRGIAALLVVIFHVLRPAFDGSPVALEVTSYGFHGVTIFFVVSGFAISRSLADVWITVPTTGRFLLRRVCRLDPPYWASFVVVWAVSALAQRVLHQPPVEFATGPATVVANVFYLQYILGITSFCDVYWTLAFEIQFYLLLVTLLAVQQRLQRLDERTAFTVVFAGPFVYSLLAARGLLPIPRGACFGSWYVFFVGVAAQRLIARGDWRTFAIVVLVAAAAAAHGSTILVVIGFSLIIALGYRHGKLTVWLRGRAWQFLGRISYSLYLVHWTVGGRFANLLNRIIGPSPAGRVLSAVVAIVVSIGFARAFWWVIERPSLALSRRIRVRGGAPAYAAAAGALETLPERS